MVVILDDPFDEWADLLTAATLDAVRAWLQTIEPELYPTLLADADDDQMPNLEALLLAVAAWEISVDDDLLPLLIGLTARRMVDMATARGLQLDDLVSDTPASGSAAATMERAIRALDAAGISTGGLDRVVWVPSWVDFIDTYARTTVNLVVGMPETVYRDLVTTLAAATRDGLAPFERARIARGFLDISSEGGYDQWMVRANRIARTETNRLINAADLQATRTEQAETGEELHKVWVATTDPRTRDTHFAADGQRVPLHGKFLIGGHEADYPGDPNLPPHESIQCRCTTIILTADEPLPGEDDRQTERARADGSVRDPQSEVDRRAADGVTRARDDQPTTVTAAAKEHPMRTTWSGILAPIGELTGDGRTIDADAEITFRDFPLPLLFQRGLDNGHDTAVVVGKITNATTDSGAIHATGEFFDTVEADEAKALVAEEVIRPSIDMADMIVEWEIIDSDGNPVDTDLGEWEDGWQEIMRVRSLSVIAATLVAKPAFAGTKLVLGEDTDAPADADEEVEALTAAATAVRTVAATAFQDPQLTGPTALTVTDDGHVFGHLALWDTEHIGMPGRGITPPTSRTDYAMFHVSTIDTDQGAVSCGRLTVGCGHAEAQAGMAAATSHYDNAGATWAFVRAGEDAHGIWVAGVINPDADEASVRAGAAAPLSGDWRSVGGNLELVAALSVNTPGFPVPRTYSTTAGSDFSLVAAAVVPRRTRDDRLAQAVAEGLRLHDQRKAEESAARERADTARTMAARMLARRVRS